MKKSQKMLPLWRIFLGKYLHTINYTVALKDSRHVLKDTAPHKVSPLGLRVREAIGNPLGLRLLPTLARDFFSKPYLLIGFIPIIAR